MAALEDVSGRKVPEDLVLSTLAGVLVSTGSLSLPALRAALSALGRPITLQELRQMGSADLKHSVAQVGCSQSYLGMPHGMQILQRSRWQQPSVEHLNLPMQHSCSRSKSDSFRAASRHV